MTYHGRHICTFHPQIIISPPGSRGRSSQRRRARSEPDRTSKEPCGCTGQCGHSGLQASILIQRCFELHSSRLLLCPRRHRWNTPSPGPTSSCSAPAAPAMASPGPGRRLGGPLQTAPPTPLSSPRYRGAPRSRTSAQKQDSTTICSSWVHSLRSWRGTLCKAGSSPRCASATSRDSRTSIVRCSCALTCT